MIISTTIITLTAVYPLTTRRPCSWFKENVEESQRHVIRRHYREHALADHRFEYVLAFIDRLGRTGMTKLSACRDPQPPCKS